MVKYKDYFKRMAEKHREEFEAFSEVHVKYALDKPLWQEEFNRVGGEVIEIVREWEKKLCGKMEKGDKAVFSSKLAEKFRAEVKACFPLIDFVGVEVVRRPVDGDEDDFKLKKLL